MSTLNPEEITALMSAIEEGRIADKDPSSSSGSASLWDFNSQDRIIRGQLPTLDAINEQIASLLGIGFSRRLRVNLGVVSNQATLQKFSDLAQVLSPPSVLCVMKLGPARGPGLCVFEPGTAEGLLGVALGDRSIKKAEQRPRPRIGLTAVEQLVMRQLISVLCEALQVAWQDILPLQPEVVRFETDPRMAAVMAQSDVAIACTFDFDSAVEGRIHLIIPYAAVEPIKAALLSPPRMSSGGDTRFSEALAGELMHVGVELRGLLGRAALRFEELLELEVGDLITLDADEKDPLPIFIESRRKLAGLPCVSGGSLALRIEHDLAFVHRTESATSNSH